MSFRGRLDPSSASVEENSGGGTSVVTVTATDADSDTITYSLDTTSDSVFDIGASSGAITVQSGANLDHEGTSSFTATVTASDGTDTASHNVTISVTDKDEPPDAPGAPSVSGASTTSVSVGWTAPDVTGKPPISDYDVQFRISGASDWSTHSFSGTGTSTTISSLSGNRTYEVQVKARNAEGDSNWSSTGSGLTHNNAPVFTSQPTTANVEENSGSGTSVVTVTATDADSDAITYSLDSTSDAVFDIGGSSGAITVQSGADLNHEGTSSYTATVTANDGRNTDTHQVTISVTDKDEPPDAPGAPSVSGASTSSVSVGWTAPDVTGKPAISGYDVRFRLSTASDWSTHSFTGTGTSTTISSLSGNRTYEVQVKAKNAEGESGWSSTGSGLTDNNAPVFTSQPTTANVEENSGGGTSVVTVTATDADSDTITLSLDSTSDAVFDIGASSGAITVQSSADLNHEGTSSYTATVTANDGRHSATHQVTISVTDKDEPPDAPGAPTVSGASTTSVSVGWTAPDVTGKPAISDYDVRFRLSTASDWSTHSFTGTGTSTTISSLSGNRSYDVQIKARNAEGESGWSSTGSGLTNNNAPVFTSQPTTASVAENSGDGTSLVTVTATDADSDSITLSLDSTSDMMFDIDSNGAITVQVDTGSALDHEATPSVTATVTADDGRDTTTHDVTITVNDVNEPPDAPGAPTVTSASLTSLHVSWTAPDTTGKPAISDYDVRFQLPRGSTWNDHDFTGTGTSTTIANREVGQTYWVQVKAKNAEGESGWSATGSGATTALAISISGGSAVTEGTAATFTLTAATAPSADLLVALRVSEASGSDFVAPGDERFHTVTIAASTTTATYSVPTQDDRIDEPDGAVTVMLGRGPGYSRGTPNSASVAVSDDDETPVFTSPPTTASVAENSPGGTPVVTVTATDADAGDTIAYSLDATSGAVFNIGSSGAITVRNGADLDYEATPSYTATVTASDGANAVTHGVTIRVTDESEPPDAPGAPTVTAASTTSVDVSWTPPANAGKPAISDYDVQYRAAGATAWIDHGFTGTGTGSTISGLTAGTTYNVQVRATNADGEGQWSASGSGATNTPGNVAPVFTDQPSTASVAENSDEGTAVVTVTATDADADDTIVYSLDAASDEVFDIDSGSGAITVGSGAALDHEATPSYAATVTASDGTVAASHALTIEITDEDEPPDAPGAPSVAGASAISVTVAWTAPDVTGKPPVTGYDVRYRASGATEWTDHDFTGTGASTTISGLTAGTAYNVQVRATNDEGDSDWSASGTGAPGSSTNIAPAFTNQPTTASVAENSPGGTAVVTITATDANGDTLSYSLDSASDAVFDIDSGSGAITVQSGADLDHEGTPGYAAAVTASDGTDTATHQVTIRVTDRNEPPDAPGAPTVASASTTAVTVRWTAPDTAGKPAIEDYDVRYRASGDDAWIDASFDGTTPVARISSLAADTAYEAQVRATNAEGTSAWSAAGSGSTDSPANVARPPGAPTGVAVSADSSTSLQVTWTAPRDTGTALAGYGVQYRATGETRWRDHPHEGTATQSVIENLRVGTAYQVRVRSLGDGDSDWTAAEGRTAVTAPAVAGALPDLTLVAGAAAVEINAGSVFAGEELAYVYTSSDGAVASFDGSDSVMLNPGETARLQGESAGEARIELTASNAGGSASVTFAVTVKATSDEEAEALGLSLDGLSRTLLAGATGVIGARLAASQTATPALPGWTVWGAGDVQRFSSGGEREQRYEGDWRTAYLGVDGRMGEHWLGGVAFSAGEGQADYHFGGADAGDGRLETELAAVYPYIKGVFGRGNELWIMLGAGTGEAMNLRGLEQRITHEGELRMSLAAAGVRSAITESGTMRLSVLADAGSVMLAIDGEQSLADLQSRAHRVRVGMELSGAGAWSPYLQLGGRFDGGENMSVSDTAYEVEAGYEAEAGLRVSGARVDFELSGRWMARPGDTEGDVEYEESGATAVLRIKSAPDGTGLTASLTPAWGRPGGTDLVWGKGPMPAMQPWAGAETGMTLNAELGYGIESWRLRGLVTPMLGYGRGAPGDGRLRFGADYVAKPEWLPAQLSIGFGLQRQQALEGHSWGGELRARMRW